MSLSPLFVLHNCIIALLLFLNFSPFNFVPAFLHAETDATKIAATKSDFTAAVLPKEDPPAVTSAPVEKTADTTSSIVDAKEPSGGTKTGPGAKVEESELSAKHRLTKEAAEKAATTSDGIRVPVVVTWANFHYKEFVMNWVDHLQATGCTNFLVGKIKYRIIYIVETSFISIE